MTAKQILDRHAATLSGKLIHKRFASRALGAGKNFYVYEPPNLENQDKVHLLYLFRGHEREWVNMQEDGSRLRSTAIEDLDSTIKSGMLPPTIAVLPGVTSSNNWVHSAGVNMSGEWDHHFSGLGSGRFYDYLTCELIPSIERRYGPKRIASKMAVGFSLGGYLVSLLTTKFPGYFTHAGIYDGTLMWANHHDPRIGKRSFNDKIWGKSFMFDASFGAPRVRRAMYEWNATDRVIEANSRTLEAIRKTKFWVASASQDGGFGNRDRSKNFAEVLERAGIQNGFSEIPFHPDAAHSWHWTDRFLIEFLRRVLA